MLVEVAKGGEDNFGWSTAAAGRRSGAQGVCKEAGMVRKGCSVDRHSPARMQSPTRLSQKADLQLAYHASPSPPSSSSGSVEEPTARERAFRPPCPLPLRQAGCWLALRGRMESGGQLVRHRETGAGEGKEGELMALMSAGSLGPASSPAPVNAPSCHPPHRP